VGPPMTGIANLRAVPMPVGAAYVGWDGDVYQARARRSHIRRAGFAACPKETLIIADHHYEHSTMFVFDDPNAQWKPITTAPFDRDLDAIDGVCRSEYVCVLDRFSGAIHSVAPARCWRKRTFARDALRRIFATPFLSKGWMRHRHGELS
jgi:hypothetical protein